MDATIITIFAGALVAVVAGLLTTFWKVWTDREKLHNEEVKRINDECNFNIGRIKIDLAEQRTYAATLEESRDKLETENEAWRNIASGLRDRCSMLQTILDTKHIPIPEERRNVTKPLDAMLVEHLEKQKGKTS
jgi:hypothetical protein